MDELHLQFVTDAATARRIDIKTMATLADGRVYTGRQAYDVKLIDKLGDFQIAADLAGEMGKVGKDPKIIKTVESFEQFFSLLNVKSDILSIKTAERFFLGGPRLEYRWEGF